MRRHKGHSELLSIGLVAAVVLYFNVEVQTALTAVYFLTCVVRANEVPINFFGRPAHVLFANLFLAPRFLCAKAFGVVWLWNFFRLLHLGFDFLFLQLLLVLHHFNAVEVLLREREHFGQQTVLVVVLDVVNSFEGFEVVRGCVLHFFQELLVVQVEAPRLAIVVCLIVEGDVLAKQLLDLGGLCEVANVCLAGFEANLLKHVGRQFGRDFVAIEKLEVQLDRGR